MSNIENIPEEMITEHINWHTRPGNTAVGGRAINPWPSGSTDATAGSGEEFLVWHKGYLERFNNWVASLPGGEKPDAGSIEPWTSIPIGLKMGMVGWNSNRAEDETRLQNMSNFSTLDELGSFLEWGLHGWLHGASAQMWSEPVLTSFSSPRSTYFWQLHGLIDGWRQQWVDSSTQIPGQRLADVQELMRLVERVRRPIPRFPEPVPEPWPPRSPQPRPDPVPFDSLTPEEIGVIDIMRNIRRR